MEEEEEQRRVAARWDPPVRVPKERGGVGGKLGWLVWAPCVVSLGQARQAKMDSGFELGPR